MSRSALITGVTGQDGAYLARFLLDRGYIVYGAHRRTSSGNLWRLEALGVYKKIELRALELLEFTNILDVLKEIRPDEVYNLAAQSFVGASFRQPLYTTEVNALGVARLLEAIRAVDPEIRFYQASTSEMFGKVHESPQSETTPFHPRSPYGVSKLYAHWLAVNYREAYGMRVYSGILFNHESPLRGLDFVTRKTSAGLARIRHGHQEVLELGNLESKRDWGFAGDYVRGMWMMVQKEEAEDYVLATGRTHSIREFVEQAAEIVGFRLTWEGEDMNLRAIDRDTGRVIIKTNPEFYRPAEVDSLVGDSAKAEKDLGWRPEVDFDGLVEMMVRADLERAASNQFRL